MLQETVQDAWMSTLTTIGSLSIHDGNFKRPHFLLTSGAHSNGYFNAGLVMEDPTLLVRACEELVAQMIEVAGLDNPPHRVVGPAMGAITLAYEMASQLSRRMGRAKTSYVEKDSANFGQMRFTRTSVQPGERVLVVEDVITTGGSVEKTIAAVIGAGGEVLPWIITLVNRSGLTKIGDRPILALIHKSMPLWDTKQDCPLCEGGSSPLRPKDANNWARLNAQYA